MASGTGPLPLPTTQEGNNMGCRAEERAGAGPESRSSTTFGKKCLIRKT